MQELLRSGWHEPRPASPPPRGWRDWALVVLLVPAAVLEGVLRPDLPWRALTVVVAAGLVPVLLWRRSRPLLAVVIAFGVCFATSVVAGGDAPALIVMLYMLLFPYALYRWACGREAVIGAAVIMAKIGVSAVLGLTTAGDAVGGVVVLFAAMALGAAVRYRSKARMRELDQVTLLERERLARDLHDTVAHHVSAMAIRAQAGLATAESNPTAAVDALRLIDAEASQALDEMRAMVRILREDRPAVLAPHPRVSDLERLAARSRTGPSVEVEVSGDVHDLPPPVGAAIYRLAQESVTNARRHARHATRIEVRVAADDTTVQLCVSDDGEAGPVRPSGGYGLVGMTERVGLLGGTCEAGPNQDRGWTVTAVLPRAGAAT